MTTYIIIDSNILYKSKYQDFSQFSLPKIYDEVIGKIQINDVEDHFTVFIPEIAINELFKQQVSAYNGDLQSLNQLEKKFNQIYEFNITIGNNLNYDEFLKIKKDEYIEYKNINILPICSKEKFANIVERALEKRAPFLGKSKESDKGFKDALIWESILDFSEKNNGDFIFLTSDKGFDKELVDEFEKNKNNHIDIIKKDDLQLLDGIIEAKSTEQKTEKTREYIEGFMYEIVEDMITDMQLKIFKQIKINSLNYTVEDFETDFLLRDINQIGTNEYKFFIEADIKAIKVGAVLELKAKFYFKITVVGTSDVMIILDEVELSTLDSELLMYEMPEYYFKTEEIYEDLENIVDFKDITLENKHSNTQKNINLETNIKNFIHLSLNDIEEYKSCVNKVIIENKIEQVSVDELVGCIEENYSYDWWKFESKFSVMKIAFKRFMKSKGITGNENLIYSNLLVDSLKKLEEQREG